MRTFNIKTAVVGVIGYGNFGNVVCKYLFPKNTIYLYSTSAKQEDLSKHCHLKKTMSEVASQADIIIPAVPIRNFEEVIKVISPHIKAGALIMDVCSVKEYPVSVMQKYTHKSVQIIATHPMFGPNSLQKRKGDMKGLPYVLSNISADKTTYESMKKYFQSLLLDVIEMTPREHDMLSAHSQFFALTIGEIAQTLQLSPTIIDTPGAAKLFQALEYMGNDKKIIEDMLTYNVYCKPILEKMTNILNGLS